MSIYLQSALGGLSVVLPGGNDLSKSVFFSSLTTLMAINIAAWGTAHDAPTQTPEDIAYQSLVVIGINTILAAPITVSAVILSRLKSLGIGYPLCYSIFLVFTLVTTSLFLPSACCGPSKAIYHKYWDRVNCLFSDYNIWFLLSIAIVQTIISVIVAVGLGFNLCDFIKFSSITSSETSSEWGVPLALTCYCLTSLVIGFLEAITVDDSLSSTDQANSWSYGQVLAMAMLTVPSFEFIKYWFTVSRTLGDVSPGSYFFNRENVKKRKYLHNHFSPQVLTVIDLLIIISRINLLPVIPWLILLVPFIMISNISVGTQVAMVSPAMSLSFAILWTGCLLWWIGSTSVKAWRRKQVHEPVDNVAREPGRNLAVKSWTGAINNLLDNHRRILRLRSMNAVRNLFIGDILNSFVISLTFLGILNFPTSCTYTGFVLSWYMLCSINYIASPFVLFGIWLIGSIAVYGRLPAENRSSTVNVV